LYAFNKAVRLSKKAALFQHRFSMQNNREAGLQWGTTALPWAGSAVSSGWSVNSFIVGMGSN
jgi:hypothetical protein